MTLSEQQRLAAIRADNNAWMADDPERTEHFDTTFLLDIIDRMAEEMFAMRKLLEQKK